MKRMIVGVTTALLLAAMLSASAGCSRGVSVLRGSEVVFRVRHVSGTALRVELQDGQEERDIHVDGWYVSSAQMSIIFERLGESDDE